LSAHQERVQHTATHCNTLQHTATHCNTLQHTATHHNTLHIKRECIPSECISRERETATDCNRLQQTATDCNKMERECISLSLHLVAVCCSLLQSVAVSNESTSRESAYQVSAHCNTLQHSATHSMLCVAQCFVVCCSVLQCVAVC